MEKNEQCSKGWDSDSSWLVNGLRMKSLSQSGCSVYYLLIQKMIRCFQDLTHGRWYLSRRIGGRNERPNKCNNSHFRKRFAWRRLRTITCCYLSASRGFKSKIARKKPWRHNCLYKSKACTWKKVVGCPAKGRRMTRIKDYILVLLLLTFMWPFLFMIDDNEEIMWTHEKSEKQGRPKALSCIH